MKHTLLVLLAFLSIASLRAQTSNLVVYNELGQDFYLSINGVTANQTPTQHLRITDLPIGRYEVQARFVNRTMPVQTMEIKLQGGRETSYALLQTPHGQGPLQFQFVSEFSLGYIPVAPSGVMSIAYTGPAAAPGTNPGAVTPPTQPVTIVQPIPQPVPVPQPLPPVEPVRPNPLPGYTGPTKCAWPMDPDQFAQAKASIASKSFSDTKMQLAKQVTRSNCLLTSQVRALMDEFSFESQKLEFAKYAYDFTYDIGNYYRINDAFGFESSIRELEKYLQTK